MLKFFAEKMWVAFAVQKLLTFFSAKNIRILYIESAKTVNEMTLNELIKLTTLWTTGPLLVNDSLKFTLSDTQICWNFFWVLYIESAKTVNEMTLNELVKLTMLWTTGPWRFPHQLPNMKGLFWKGIFDHTHPDKSRMPHQVEV